ncbi:uncharacterized protein LOC110855949 isoform X2 [Folsomia candida]|uniref:uncharacterized protein LOC110855949 isoform X2 n=1 Tax=Folsomia candida TaxID=158441 RepID=UPI001605382F|nr:uncharacterized protein LOC110855949 isoform X2 [Folsomia candida]XP_035713823.1 uncharacterized protein LOC110855949 isoform X2 [Folsomia candida]XP_035713830.1 uncharacterized protein LOC110855949 isoform X2 [Folsomia candida]
MDLDNNHDNENPHLAVKLPEIATNIVTFLPKSDLISCTLINSAWEQEARKRLLFLSHFILDAENVAHHQEISSVRGNSARNIGVVEFPNLSREGPCGNFISTHGHKVNRLETRLLPPDVTWPQYFETLSNSFPNLTSVVLLIDNLDNTDSPQNRVFFPKVKNLAIYTPWNFMKPQEILSTQLAPLFPNLVTLFCQRIRQSVVESFLHFSPNVTSLILINVPLFDPIRENTVKLTRLEIGHDYIHTLLPAGLTAMLKMSSGTLETLSLARVENIDPSKVRNDKRLLVCFPILPKLRVFEIVHNDFSTKLEGKVSPQATPAINLKFEKGSAQTKLPYAEQFPVLETLRFWKGASSRKEKLTEQEFFEGVVSFLYNSFLHSTNTPCESLRDLAIPLKEDRDEKFKVFDVSESAESKEVDVQGGFEWKNVGEFLDRLDDVFPNLVHLYKVEDEKELGTDENAAK